MQDQTLDTTLGELRRLERKIRDATEPQGSPSSTILALSKMIVWRGGTFEDEETPLVLSLLSSLIGDSEWPGQYAESDPTGHLAERIGAAI
jgi:hypothetical protein